MITSLAEVRRHGPRFWCPMCATTTTFRLSDTGDLATCRICRNTWDANTVTTEAK